MKYLIVMVCVCLLSGCALLGTYNSRNLFEVTGEKMDFNYGLIAMKDVNKVTILRETNAGKGPAPKPLPPMCMAAEEPDPKTLEAVCEELRNEEPEDN